jgi:hypothetical protein
MARGIEELAQKEPTSTTLATWLLFLLFHPGPSPIGWCFPHSGWVSLLSCSPTCQSSLETPSQTSPGVCFANSLNAPQANQVDIRSSHNKDLGIVCFLPFPTSSIFAAIPWLECGSSLKLRLECHCHHHTVVRAPRGEALRIGFSWEQISITGVQSLSNLSAGPCTFPPG